MIRAAALALALLPLAALLGIRLLATLGAAVAAFAFPLFMITA